MYYYELFLHYIRIVYVFNIDMIKCLNEKFSQVDVILMQEILAHNNM